MKYIPLPSVRSAAVTGWYSYLLTAHRVQVITNTTGPFTVPVTRKLCYAYDLNEVRR